MQRGKTKCMQISFLRFYINWLFLLPVLFASCSYYCSSTYVMKCQVRFFFFHFMFEFWSVNNSTYNLCWGKTWHWRSFYKHTFFFWFFLWYEGLWVLIIKETPLPIFQTFSSAKQTCLKYKICDVTDAFFVHLSKFHPEKEGESKF